MVNRISTNAFEFHVTQHAKASPLIVSSPHSGRDYSGFVFDCPQSQLRQAEDFLVDELVSGAPGAGAALLTASVPRACIDLNRAEDDIDPAILTEVWPHPLNPSERTLRGLGLIRRLCRDGKPVYSAGLTITEVERRIARFYRPYHEKLEQLMAERVARFGHGLLIDAHSMSAFSLDGRHARADFVIGNLDGRSCGNAYTARLRDALTDMGYTVALNDPYKGQEILRRHGRPAMGRHALQLEINRGLYMDEAKLEKTAGFAQLKRDLTSLFDMLVSVLDIDHDAAAE